MLWHELFFFVILLWAIMASFTAWFFRIERDYWQREAEASQDEAVRWERRVAEHEGSKGNGNA